MTWRRSDAPAPRLLLPDDVTTTSRSLLPASHSCSCSQSRDCSTPERWHRSLRVYALARAAAVQLRSHPEACCRSIRPRRPRRCKQAQAECSTPIRLHPLRGAPRPSTSSKERGWAQARRRSNGCRDSTRVASLARSRPPTTAGSSRADSEGSRRRAQRLYAGASRSVRPPPFASEAWRAQFSLTETADTYGDLTVCVQENHIQYVSCF